MEPQAKYSLLLRELERFFIDDVVAIAHDNWEFYRQLLKKKQRHLKAIKTLSPLVAKDSEMALIARIKGHALNAYNLLEKKYAERKQEYARLEKAKFKIRSVRTALKSNKAGQVGTKYA